MKIGHTMPELQPFTFHEKFVAHPVDVNCIKKVLHKLFFQNEAQKVLYKPVLISDLISHFWWSFIASQTPGKLKNQQNQISSSVHHSYITKNKLRTFEASEALEAIISSFWEAPGSNSHIIIT